MVCLKEAAWSLEVGAGFCAETEPWERRYSAAAEAHILWGLGIRDRAEVAQLAERLQAAGMPTLDISGIEAAQVLPCSFLAGMHARPTLKAVHGRCCCTHCSSFASALHSCAWCPGCRRSMPEDALSGGLLVCDVHVRAHACRCTCGTSWAAARAATRASCRTSASSRRADSL